MVFAAGAFNWRVAVGDRVRVTDYSAGDRKLSMEASAEEITWSRSAGLDADQVMAWFGKAGGLARPRLSSSAAIRQNNKTMAKWLVIALLAINVIPLFVAFDDVFETLLFFGAALYLPAVWLDGQSGDDA